MVVLKSRVGLTVRSISHNVQGNALLDIEGLAFFWQLSGNQLGSKVRHLSIMLHPRIAELDNGSEEC